MAHKKGLGSSKNGRDSNAQRLGVKAFAGQLVSGGSIISGGSVRRSILSPRVRVNSYSEVEESVLMDGVEVGRHARVRRAIVDKGVKIPPYASIGYDLDADRKQFTVTESGIVVIPKGAVIET
ncbi:MAG: hypothetical protein E4H44_06455 [Candidatus Aminicenantes bacterium]|nr:MAG: hypothetical protein E4H44_06455 [Candidatus Aminicenantes bacterium]